MTFKDAFNDTRLVIGDTVNGYTPIVIHESDRFVQIDVDVETIRDIQQELSRRIFDATSGGWHP